MSSSHPQIPFPTFSGLSLTAENIRLAHNLIKPYIHRTPLLTCQTLNTIASTPRHPGAAAPKINLYFKCENYQKIGAFKARGAFHAVIQLIEKLGLEEVRRKGVVTHSSGNHAQALSLAASTFQIPAYIVMPTISTPSKVAATQALTPHVVFSGSTSQEREEKVKEVIDQTGAILIPPYDHGDVVLGQGTVGLEMEEQFAGRREGQVCTVYGNEIVDADDEGVNGSGDSEGVMVGGGGAERQGGMERRYKRPSKQLDAIITPCGGGGLFSGIATYFFDGDRNDNGNRNGAVEAEKSHASVPTTTSSILLGQKDENTQLHQQQPLHPPVSITGFLRPPPHPRNTPPIIGAEALHQSANTAHRSLQLGHRIPTVNSLTIADGLRTPLGHLNWSVISDREKVQGVYGVSEAEIKDAMRLLMERAKWVVEPSGAVGLAVVLFDEGFRTWVVGRQRETWEGRRQRRQRREDGGRCGGAKEGGGREGGEVGTNEAEDEEEYEIQAWNIGVVLSGGNTTLDAIVHLFGPTSATNTQSDRVLRLDRHGSRTEWEEEQEHE